MCVSSLQQLVCNTEHKLVVDYRLKMKFLSLFLIALITVISLSLMAEAFRFTTSGSTCRKHCEKIGRSKASLFLTVCKCFKTEEDYYTKC
ncbi:hypothetical protein EB796_007746 [Bugula neritina]|uniref:Uncharacterized protein n=1 Tax=Bugula neritina TaxID=10212 RepID=A0A7J7K5P4_BUGNE|nr:hypothetical protein EB796_007746 [Bugula neritina]